MSEERANKQITMTPRLARRLLSAYKAAVSTNKEIFVFEGNRYLTGYAKHLVAYAVVMFPAEVELKREFENVKQ